jgi:prophage DNA circulation protein
MSLQDSLVALFQGPANDSAIEDTALVSGYIAVFKELTVYADEVDAINPTTQDLIERQESADLFVTSCMAACFAAMAEGMAAKTIDSDYSSFHENILSRGADYSTYEDVEYDLGWLQTAWDTLMGRSLDATARSQLIDVYNRTTRLLQDLAVTLPRVGEMSVPGFPASVLAYMLYDDPDREIDLIKLNPEQPPMLYDGTVEILVTS